MTRLDCQNWHGRSGKLRKHWGDLCRSKDCHHLSHRKHLRTSSCRGYCMSRQTVYQRRQEHETGYLGDRTDYVHLLPAVQTGHSLTQTLLAKLDTSLKQTLLAKACDLPQEWASSMWKHIIIRSIREMENPWTLLLLIVYLWYLNTDYSNYKHIFCLHNDTDELVE